MKRSQTSCTFIEAKRERSAGVNHNVFKRLILSRFVPASISAVIEDEPEIVNLAVIFSRLQCFRVSGGQLFPRWITRLLVEDPHHPRQKAIAPTRPRRLRMTPAPTIRVERIKIRIALNQRPHLRLRESKRLINPCFYIRVHPWL